MKKPRVMVLRLFDQRYWLGKDGRATTELRNAVQFLEVDAYRFLTALYKCDRNDMLWGSSLEMLPKRLRDHLHMPLTHEEFRAFLIVIKTSRMEQEADRYDRMAAGYLHEARHAEHMAQEMRQKAETLRATLKASIAC